MQNYVVGQSNELYADVVDKTTGNPITSGTVNGYLRAVDGTNAGKYWDGASGSWSATEIVAGAMTHVADGHWALSVVSAAWTTGVRYRWYWKESGDLHIACSEDVVEERSTINVTIGSTVEST